MGSGARHRLCDVAAAVSECRCGGKCDPVEQMAERHRVALEDARLRNRSVRCSHCGARRMARPVSTCPDHPHSVAVPWEMPEIASWRYLTSADVVTDRDVERFIEREFEPRPQMWPGVMRSDLERVGLYVVAWGGRLPDEAPAAPGDVSPRGLFG